MAQWSDIVGWSNELLLDAAEDLRTQRQTAIDLATDVQASLNAIQSEGEAVDAMWKSLRASLNALDDLINALSETMMATAEASDGVSNVEALVEKAQKLATEAGITINSDGSIPIYYYNTTKSSDQNISEAQSHFTVKSAIEAAITEAEAVDQAYDARLAAVADGTYQSSETHSSTSPGLANLPDSTWSTTEVAMWWSSLTADEQLALRENPKNWELLGNLNGLPAAVRDEANRNRLPGMIEDAQQELDDAKAEYEEMARIPWMSWPALQRYWDRVVNAENMVNDLRTVEATLAGSSSSDPLSLLVLDAASGDRLKAAVAVGDVDSTEHVAAFVPGMTTNVNDSLADYTANMVRLRKATADNTDALLSDVATIAWLGYDAPQALDTGDFSVMSTDKAQAGADSLAPFLEGINASRTVNGSDPHFTLLGHSYGSTTSGLAMTDVDADVVDDFIMFGSPGSGVTSVSEYAIDPGHVYVSGVPEGDMVQGMGPDSTFGTNPLKLEGVEHLSGDATGSSDYQKHGIHPFRNHSTYLDENTQTLHDISQVVGGER